MGIPKSPRLVGWTCFVLGSLLLSFLLLEGAVRGLDRIKDFRNTRPMPPQPKSAMYFGDPRLGHRPNPAWPSHDARGWRNAEARETAEVVALGDSQTYGLNVPSERAWPQVMARLTGLSVYQMAFGMYGPAHFVPLAEDAGELRPRILVAAYYFGNDVLDNYRVVYDKQPAEFRRRVRTPALDAIVSRDPEVLDGLARAERIDPQFIRSTYLDCQLRQEVPHPDFQRIHGFLDRPPLDVVRASRSPFRIGSFDLFHHSRFLQIVDETLRGRNWRGISGPSVPQPVVAGAGGERLAYPRPICVPFQVGPVKTVFSPAYRLLTLSPEDPRVREGARLSREALELVARQSRAAGIRFYVLLIPTKELAFRRFAASELSGESYLSELWDAETRLRNETIAYLTRDRIAVIDSLPYLESRIAAGKNPYKQAHDVPLDDADGHPDELGYDAIAHAVADRLAADGVVPGAKTVRR